MRTTTPQLVERTAQHTVGIRATLPFEAMDAAIPGLVAETAAWLADRDIDPAGAPFCRLHVIDMTGVMDFEVGWPVAARVAGDDRVAAGELPAGTYGTLVYTDATRGIEGNGVLIGWAEAEGVAWDARGTPEGDAFVSRVEFFLDGPDDDEDPTRWDTELFIKVAEPPR